jgi:hypothetical protein
MPKIRSPNYPVMDLGDALEAMRPVYKAEHRNKMSRETLAKHLGYTSLNGRALGKIGAVRAYGLVEGTGDALWVSDDTITVLMAPDDSRDRAEALKRRALHPALFQQIGIDESGHLPSETNLKYRLIKKGFTEEAASKAADRYLATMRLVEGAYPSYDSAENTEDNSMQASQLKDPKVATHVLKATAGDFVLSGGSGAPEIVPQGARREVITLDEGDVVITFPDNLSADSFGDLKDHLDLFVKKMQRRAAQ